MAPTASAFRAARPLFSQSFVASQTRHAFRQSQGFRYGGYGGGKRWQSTAEGAQQSWFKRIWESEVGIKTVHFWAPVMKWAIVIAGISDLGRPAEKLSLTQNAALTATGIIWTRWCFVIKPKNYLLAAVNFFLGCVGIAQLTRIAMYEKSKNNKTVGDVINEAKADVKETADQVKEAVKT